MAKAFEALCVKACVCGSSKHLGLGHLWAPLFRFRSVQVRVAGQTWTGTTGFAAGSRAQPILSPGPIDAPFIVG